jgi:hypothetical protein
MKGVIARFVGLSIPVKFLIGFGGSALCSIGVGVMAEFASYSYALYWNVRPPVEGIPFLRATVSAIILIMISASALALFFTYQVLEHFRSRFEDSKITGAILTNDLIDAMGGDKNERPAPSMIEVLTSVIARALAGVGFILLSVWSVARLGANLGIILSTGATISLFVLGYLSFVWPQLKGWIAGLIAITLFIAIPIMLFNPHYYGALLRLLDYGGGIPVTVLYEENKSNQASYEGELVFRTTSGLILVQPEKGAVTEIPSDKVTRINYHGKNARWINAGSL